ncbi:DUF1810 domain-containing protein [Dactylosporangium sp. AC04546]|uniref:DUF1810 domain-containing protein n=1 Tax=Dactylosporangium sp. AC04546 TaxID=2862460 RepID=UPI001EDD8541|nr:DUF1810 domain-containing protein [Dactylosporangium sp. AC04546]WVK89266.1 DUF1810 domain-containing protein [Dactylosporangium sp. AC04546]
MDDPYDLSRFAHAQSGVYEQVVGELGRARKTGHWMWYIFPQVAGLGFSEMSRRYAIRSLDEARAYLEHPVLGPRLLECTQLLLAGTEHTAAQILGDVDALKLRSSMTLFHQAEPGQPLFQRVLDRFYEGTEDAETLRRLT